MIVYHQLSKIEDKENENEKSSLPPGSSPKPGPSPKPEVRVVRPFVRALKVKPISDVSALLSQIITNQEKQNSKASPYEDAICIFNKDFATELDDIQVMYFIGLLSDNSSLVNQFLTFNSTQRGIISLLPSLTTLRFSSHDVIVEALLSFDPTLLQLRPCHSGGQPAVSERHIRHNLII